ncbi:sigma-70 family RNA polymerase sigma factor [Pirellulaceae bacterium]|nr:sigma-70 family RNA polymerase sigma factor [Pirellulaceae bacterium]
MPSDPWPVTRASIIGRLKNAHDHKAWNLVVEIYSPLLFRYCRSRGLQQEDAFDVAQEVLVRLQKFDYHPERGKFRAWLGTVARHQVALFYRKKNKKDDGDMELENMTVDPDLDWQRISHSHILDTAIKRIRGEFRDDEWDAFSKLSLLVEESPSGVRFVWHQHGSPQDVAQELNHPVEWVYKSKSLVLSRLRDEILFLADELAILE